MRIDADAFRAAWPKVVRALSVTTRSLDLGEECAAEAFARAAAQPPGTVDDLVAWCVRVGERTWLDGLRHRAVHDRLRPQLARPEVAPVTEPVSPGDALDDRLALLFVACDDALSPGAQLVLAMRVVCGLTVRQIAAHLGIGEATAAARLTRAKSALARARGEFVVPGPADRLARVPVVLACVAGLLTVGQREATEPPDPTQDPGRDALTLAEALVAELPGEPEVLALRAVCRLALARRPGRVREGVALPLDEVDRSRWDRDLLAAGLRDATRAGQAAQRLGVPPGRFVLEASISGLHATADPADPALWVRLAVLHDALVAAWPSPAARVARLVVLGRQGLAEPGRELLADVERELEDVVSEGPPYAARDASLALADLAWRTGRAAEAAGRYRELVDVMPAGPLREFCRRRAASTAG